MLINGANLDALFKGFNTSFNKGLGSAPMHYQSVAMMAGSTGSEETYGWLGDIPRIREWAGDRVVAGLAGHSYSIVNRTFESTVRVKRESIEDDKYGIYGPLFETMGRQAAEYPDELVMTLLRNGFTTKCYDGQHFFDTDHPVLSGDVETSVSNVQSGSGPAWFLLDTSKPIRPLIYQERRKPALTPLDKANDQNVFFRNEYIYGVDFRCAAGFGLWQLAFASKAELTAENYEAARQAMMDLRGDSGRPLGVTPNVLVVPTILEGAAMRLLNNGTRIVLAGDPAVPVPVQNEWKDTAKPIVSPWVRE